MDLLDGPPPGGLTMTDDPAGAAETTDGRSLRRRRNRDAVVEAALELIAERRTTPTIDEVAERSGLSARSVFRYFDDTDDLVSAVIRRQRRRIAPLWEPTVTASGSLGHRIDRFVDARIALVEAQGGVAWVARVRATDQPLIATELNRVRIGLRQQVAAIFGPELSALGADAPAVLAAIDVLASWEADDLLRRGHGADGRDVAAMMRVGLRRLLAPAGVAGDSAAPTRGIAPDAPDAAATDATATPAAAAATLTVVPGEAPEPDAS